MTIGLTILYFVYKEQSSQYLNFCLSQGQPEESCNLIDKIVNDLKNAKPFWLIMTLVLYFISNISRAIKWKILVEPDNGSVRTINTFLATMVGYFANLAIPRFGEFVRAGMLSKHEKIDPAEVMGTVVTDRLLDVLCLVIMFGLGLLLASGQLLDYIQANAQLPNISSFMISGLILGFLLLGGLLLFLTIRFQNHKIIVNLKVKIKSFINGVLSIRRVKNYKWLIFHSVNIWLMYYLMTYLPLLSFEATEHLSPIAGLLVFIFAGLGMVLPAPGGMGTFHAMVIAGLSIYGIAGPDAFSFAMIIYLAINICINLAMGIISLILLPIVNKNYHPIRHNEE